jgi:3-hydroxy-9,10-secoandrosta-1,3,5(10)-triene-9,17-dione monooxygenase
MTMIECVSEVSRHCGSTGWCMCFLLQHQWFLGLFPEAAQRAVYRMHADPKIVTSFAPMGKATPTAGGYEFSGDWSFGSGGDHCDWAIVGAIVPPTSPDGHPSYRVFLLKPGQFRMRDTWNSVGLKGTGSNNIVVDPTFVSDDFTLDMADAREGRAPGGRLNDGKTFNAPLGVQFTFGILTPMLGLARGALDAFCDFTRDKRPLMGGDKAAELIPIQIRLGESEAEIDAAWTIAEKLNAKVFGQDSFTIEDRTRSRRDFVLAARLLLRAVDRLLNVSGARGLDDSNPLQRHWRDLHAMAVHVVFTDTAFQTGGRMALGLGPAASDGLY